MDKIDAKIVAALRQNAKIDNGLVGVLENKEEKIDALVRVRNPLQLGLLERNFDVIKSYPFIRSVGIKCGLGEAIRLERMQEVEYVSAQSTVFALSDFDEKNGKYDGNVGNCNKCDNGRNSRSVGNVGNREKYINGGNNEKVINNEKAYSNGMFSQYPIAKFSKELTGEGVTLCVMDTGINPHCDLSVPRNRIVHFEDMVGGEVKPYDDNGHGTFVAGVACGDGFTSAREVVGVAPKANVLGIKVIGDKGESGTFKILDGMQWLFDNFRQYGVKVVCMSFGAEPLSYADPLKIGVEMLSRSGLIVVAAAGNSGENSLKSPAISNEIIAVGAVDKEDRIAEFSSRGVYQGAKRPDVYADGIKVKGIKAGGSYTYMSGTSVAAPYVAGACCLLCEKYRNLTPYQAKQAVLYHSSVVGDALIFRV